MKKKPNAANGKQRYISQGVQANLDLRNPIFSFLNKELFDLRKICVMNLKTSPMYVLIGKMQVEICLKFEIPPQMNLHNVAKTFMNSHLNY